MSKRYSATRTKSPTLNRKRILLAWLMIIIAIMLPAIMYYLKYRHTNVQIKTVTKIQTKNNKPLKFDFYTMLPNMEVPIPAPQKTSTQSILKTAPGAYILQVASVKTEPAANRIRDQLLELGYRAFVQAYKNQQSVGYRVING
ncbi:MAG: SPOR domain-containing protein, partial [Gammaproteobacteria bacterium]|nr:SPOR domain-containing protein [Gammaproteobacteria bacterium]